MAYTVNQIIQGIMKTVPGAPVEDTVDTLKAGDGEMVVTGVVTTFIATVAVIRRAVELGANFIITHESTYFNHRDAVDWLADDPVYAAKQALIEQHHLAVWRFHDHWHMHQPDGIYTGLVKALGWESFQDAENPIFFHLPPTRMADLADFFQGKLGRDGGAAAHMRIVGPLDLECQKVAIYVGSYPGEFLIQALGAGGADVLVCGEASEWQVYEYVRDANAAGLPKGLIVLGHERSEEPGMHYLVEWLGARFPGLPVQHVPAGDPLVIR